MIIVTNVTLFFRNYGNKCICSIYSYQNVVYIHATSPKSEYQGRKMPICSQVFSEHGKRDIYFFSFLSFFTHHFRLSIQPFHVGKVVVNRSFAVKLIPHEFYALDQWNFNPKKKTFFWSHSKVSSPSVNMMHVPFIHHCQIYDMLYKSSWPKYHG